MSLFSDLFNKKKLDSKAENRQAEIENNTEDAGLDDTASSSFEAEREEKSEEFMDATEADDLEYEVVEREIHPAKMICPDCGGITLEGLDFCDKCGGELLS